MAKPIQNADSPCPSGSAPKPPVARRKTPTSDRRCSRLLLPANLRVQIPWGLAFGLAVPLERREERTEVEVPRRFPAPWFQESQTHPTRPIEAFPGTAPSLVRKNSHEETQRRQRFPIAEPILTAEPKRGWPPRQHASTNQQQDRAAIPIDRCQRLLRLQKDPQRLRPARDRQSRIRSRDWT